MSRVEHAAESKSFTEAPVQEEKENEVEHQRRIFVHLKTSASQLRHGVVQAIANNPTELFRPQLAADASAKERNADYSKPIISKIKLNSVMSSCPSPVTLGMNIHNIKNPEVVNSEGRLFTKQADELSANHQSNQDGFENLASILPYEKGRMSVDLYTPTNLLNSEQVSMYGGYTLDSLWSEIIPFPGQSFYYVPQTHIVTSIIEKNWDKLQVNLEHEKVLENGYLKLSAPLVKSVIEQLYTSVISRIPYTDVSNLSVRLQSNVEGNDKYDVCAELLVSYRYPRA